MCYASQRKVAYFPFVFFILMHKFQIGKWRRIVEDAADSGHLKPLFQAQPEGVLNDPGALVASRQGRSTGADTLKARDFKIFAPGAAPAE